MVRHVYRDRHRVLYPHELPQLGGHGFSVHNGTIVVWDHDHDPRILGWLDSLPEDDRGALVAAGERKAGLTLVWEGVPRLAVGVSVEEPGGDSWLVESSTSLSAEVATR